MIIINYHQISTRGGTVPYALPWTLFERQIDALIENGFSFVTLATLLDAPSVEHALQCAITFDDGRSGAYQHGFPILRERGIEATYFLCPGWLEKNPTASAEAYSDFMTWDHVSELAEARNVIGSHGMSHLPFFEIDVESAAREVIDSKRVIEQKLGTPCEHFACPWGQIDRTVAKLVRDSGYKTLSSTVAGPNKIPYDLFRLRRIDSSLYRSPRSFEKAILEYVGAHSRFDVALCKLEGDAGERMDPTEPVARFDLAVCLDDRSYELCVEFGLSCLRHDPGRDGNREPPREWLLKTHGDRIRDRGVTFTPVTLGETRSAWTFLSSFLLATNRIR